MRAFKENPVFFSLTALLLLCSVVFSILSLLAFGKKSGNRDDFDKSQRDLKRLITSKPYPTGGNLEKSKLNLEGLQTALSDHKGKLLAEGVLDLIPSTTPDYELAVKERIKNGYIKSMRDAAIANRVKITNGEAFGFSDYSGMIASTNNDLLGQALDKQRAILDYIIGELLDSTSPDSSDITELISIQREQVESAVAPTLTISSEDVFFLDSKMSARVEGAIDTHAFRLEFIGYTSGLRNFFNKLALFKRPVVVRDVRVQRKQSEPEVAAIPTVSPINTPFGSPPFGTPSGRPPFGSPVASAEPAEELVQKPIVDKNLSRFIIIVEYIELAESVQETEDGQES